MTWARSRGSQSINGRNNTLSRMFNYYCGTETRSNQNHPQFLRNGGRISGTSEHMRANIE
jgi:hypothetical protein